MLTLKNIENLANGLARKLPRLKDRKGHSIKPIQSPLRSFNPGALAQSICQIFNVLQCRWNSSLKAIPLLFTAAGIAFFIPGYIGAAQKNWDYAQDTNTSLREMRDSIEDVKHEVKNHEVEIRTFEEKLNNQASTMDSLRQQILDATQASKELVKGNVNSQETKMSQMETLTKGLVADFKVIKTHSNETAGTLEQLDQRLSRLEKAIEVQNRNIANLQSAMSSLAGAFDVKEPASAASAGDTSSAGKKYRVKPGDSLEKIARNNGTSIKAIKELNNMSSDKIVVGQTLEMP